MLDIPGGHTAHYFLQRHVTRNWPRPVTSLKSLQNVARRVVEDYARYVGGTPSSALEIGAGRDLAVPLALRRLGVGKVVASDVERLARPELIQHAARNILAGRARIENWDDLRRFGICYLAPHHVTESDPKVDCSCSNEVLEHVPPDQLVRLLAALRTVTKGITTHSIDYSDHYARSDRSLSRLNFLRYSDAQWRRFNSGRQYVNRLRHSDYISMFRDAGFEIIKESKIVGELPPAIEANMASQFTRYERDDLVATSGIIVARPA